MPAGLIGAHLTTTGNTTVFTAVGYVQVIGIRLANIAGSNAVATASRFSSGVNDQYHLLFQHAVPANEQM
ncbi:hypothetical protein MesoLjLc_22100 [Mesorhizobium sp. L-8-10]|uniref:hypothetical protein n=1 Tax=unclassified Mesorhizobium TaxID=325217 RepID=UPI001926A867|nr:MULTISPECIES: hypothetical protein [unclassified Mesorhizobium]BCH22465.1 hypothetical protein MesoLjLb_22500 [Mesorhizobium sp. L-8-3]BCH30280.1 hypothetical protein MesoLjLc_22100 [Mesorhizobium sp. L-8-10]